MDITDFTLITTLDDDATDTWSTFGVLQHWDGQLFVGTDGGCNCCSTPFSSDYDVADLDLVDMGGAILALTKWGRAHHLATHEIQSAVMAVVHLFDDAHQAKVSEAKAAIELAREHYQALAAELERVQTEMAAARTALDNAHKAYNALVD